MDDIADDIAASEQRAHESVDRAAESAREGLRYGEEAAHGAVDRVSENAGRFAANARRLNGDVSAYASAHPLRALAVALAAGFIVGRFLR